MSAATCRSTVPRFRPPKKDVQQTIADLVLLKQDLDILRAGIDEGRTTFANTLKYILTTTI